MLPTEDVIDGRQAARKAGRHMCVLDRMDGFCRIAGPAATYCYEESDNSLWAGNGEYESAVRFCPFCGSEGKWPPAAEISEDE